MKKLLFGIFAAVLFASCTENYSNGERIGMISKFSEKGVFWKSWEGDMVLTQTGMNQSANGDFVFSIDNDRPDTTVIKLIDSAANFGWKVKLTYHEVFGYNWFGNRGETDHFITKVEVLNKNMMFNTPFKSGIDIGNIKTEYYLDTLIVLRKK